MRQLHTHTHKYSHKFRTLIIKTFIWTVFSYVSDITISMLSIWSKMKFIPSSAASSTSGSYSSRLYGPLLRQHNFLQRVNIILKEGILYVCIAYDSKHLNYWIYVSSPGNIKTTVLEQQYTVETKFLKQSSFETIDWMIFSIQTFS